MTIIAQLPIQGLSEFAGGNNDDCGPNAEEMALAILQQRWPTPQHMTAIRSRMIANGIFTPGGGCTIEDLAKDIGQYETGIQAKVYSAFYGSFSAEDVVNLLGLAESYLINGFPVIVGVTNAGVIPGNEKGVRNHFIVLAGFDDQGNWLIGNGDQIPWKGGTNWVSTQDLINGQASAAMVVQATGVGTGQSSAMTSPAQLWPWLNGQQLVGGNNINPWNGSSEKGIDIGMPLDTPITSLTAGTVLQTVIDPCYAGVVSVRSQIPGIGAAAVYYQHLDQVLVSPGQLVRLGDLLGYSGGQLQGGHNPGEPQCTTGPHLEVGINGGPQNSVWNGLGPNINPTSWLQSLQSNGPSTYDLALSIEGVPGSGSVNDVLTALQNSSQGTGPIADEWAAILEAVDNAMATVPLTDVFNYGGSNVPILGGLIDVFVWIFANLEALTARAMVVVIGLWIIVALIWQLVKPAAETTLKVAGTAATVGAAVAP